MDIEQQLRVALSPVSPGPHVEAGVMRRLTKHSRRPSNRWLLAIAALAVGAAAAMLVMDLRRPAPPSAIAETAAENASAPGLLEMSVRSDERPFSGVVEQPAPIGSSSASATAAPFSVQVLPLKTEVSDPAYREAIEASYRAFVSGLHNVPGARVLLEDAAIQNESGQPAYRLILTGRTGPGPTPAGTYFVEVEAQRQGPNGRPAGTVFGGAQGKISPGCNSPEVIDVLTTESCDDPAGVAASLLSLLRKMVFPPDPLLQRRLQMQLADQSRDPALRLLALRDLRTLGHASGAVRTNAGAAFSDPAAVRAAIHLAESASDPAARAEVWYSLRGARDPQLVDPLVAALRGDPDDDARVQALESLTAEFAADPRSQAALQAAAETDSNAMVRALARRALGNSSEWTAHVLDSLKDINLPPVERVAALFHAYGLPSPRMYGSFSADASILQALDDEAMLALAEVIPQASAESRRYASATNTLVSHLAHMEHPAITDMLIDELATGRPKLDPGMIMRALQRRDSDPKVRAVLERIAADPSDPVLQGLALGALRSPRQQQQVGLSAADLALARGGLRIGVITDVVRATADVPREQVGKLAVMRVLPGSVADRAGMREGDVLLELDGRDIASSQDLTGLLDVLKTGESVEVTVSRDGQVHQLSAHY